MIVTIKSVRHDKVIGKVKIDGSGKPVEGDEVMSALVTDVVRRVGVSGLNGWTNGYVQLKAS
jgi:hypothetical protein